MSMWNDPKNIGKVHLRFAILAGCSPTVEAIAPPGTDQNAVAAALAKRLQEVVMEFLGPTAEWTHEPIGVEDVGGGTILPPEEQKAASDPSLKALQSMYAQAEVARQKAIDANPDNGKAGYWDVDGIRNGDVVEASTERAAIDKALERGTVGDWESPRATFRGTKL